MTRRDDRVMPLTPRQRGELLDKLNDCYGPGPTSGRFMALWLTPAKALQLMEETLDAGVLDANQREYPDGAGGRRGRGRMSLDRRQLTDLTRFLKELDEVSTNTGVWLQNSATVVVGRSGTGPMLELSVNEKDGTNRYVVAEHPDECVEEQT